MSDQKARAGHLKKIILSIEAGSLSDTMDLTRQPERLEFIFGIGKNGFTPFEYALVDREIGESALVQISRQTAPSYFEHLTCDILKNVDTADAFYLKAEIIDILQPDNRDIIKAMAASTGCAGGCDCGCSIGDL